ncbi:acyltransferase domain-containing protein [Kitasatospora purpeofusca]|uniref:acyltransferase domain-containing protein n=1 Tax=Kitasatospora purpeofusca TaxID=67352 RepID=UPI003B01DE00
MIAETDFDGRDLRYDLDPLGQVVRRTTPMGGTIHYERDLAGRVTRKSVDGRTTSYAYAPGGQLLHASGPDGDLSYQYDRSGRVKTELADGRVTTHAYDALGRRTRRVTPIGQVTTYAYDAAGQLVRQTSGGQEVNFDRDSAGRELSRRFGEMLTFTTEWDAAGRVAGQETSSGGRSLNRRTYDYRADGMLIGIDDELSGPRRFDHDPPGGGPPGPAGAGGPPAPRLLDYTEARGPAPADAARTLAEARTLLAHRAVVVADALDGHRTGLAALAGDAASPALVTGAADVAGQTVLVFPGQGSQWVGMGRRLLAESAVFAEALAEVGKALEPYTDWSLLDVVNQVPGAASLERVDVVQPVSFAVNVGLARLWASLGVVPDAVVGHSQGEIAAAHVAGILSLEDAAAVVALRSQAIARGLAGRGGMVSLGLPLARVADRLPAGVEVAAVNGPTSVVVAGDPAGLDTLVTAFEEQGVRVRRIPVDYASHTAHVESIEAELAELLGAVKPQPAAVPFLSTVENRWLEGPELDAGYWYRNLRQTVRFAEAVETLAAAEYRAFVEVSAHPVLAHGLVEALEAASVRDAAVTGTLRRDEGGWDRVLLSAAALHVRGVEVDWSASYAGAGTLPASELPTYPFQHRHYWLESVPVTTTPAGDSPMATETEPDTVVEEAPGAALARRLADAAPEERQAVLVDVIRTEVASVLGHEDTGEIGADAVFFDIGFVSLTAVELRNRLQNVTGLELPALLAFDQPTPERLAGHLLALFDESGADVTGAAEQRTEGK